MTISEGAVIRRNEGNVQTGRVVRVNGDTLVVLWDDGRWGRVRAADVYDGRRPRASHYSLVETGR